MYTLFLTILSSGILVGLLDTFITLIHVVTNDPNQ